MLTECATLNYFLYLCNVKLRQLHMDKTFNRLQEIESQMEAIGENIRKEEQVYRAELEERQRLGLHGEDAIRHYNEWMKRHNMSHLMVKEG